MTMIFCTVLTVLLAVVGPVADTHDAAGHQSAPTAPLTSEDLKIGRRAKAEFSAWQNGWLDRTLYSSEANEQLSSDVVDAVSEYLRTLGTLRSMSSLFNYKDGDTTVYVYSLRCESGAVRMKLGFDSTGKISLVSFQRD
jgi:hypothetical protein